MLVAVIDVMLASRWSVYLVLRQSEETWQGFYECEGEWESRCFASKMTVGINTTFDSASEIERASVQASKQ
jgi:hypothetical protein